MQAAKLLQKGLLYGVDGLHAALPRRTPKPEELRNCKIVSHRGEHDNRSILENTVPAFEQAVAAGVFGIELDIRWTSDLHPVVFHDHDCVRIFGSNTRIAETPLSTLKEDFPQIPTLEEVIRRFGGASHLMIEIKKENYRKPDVQNRILEELMSDLEGGIDYHLITLNPELFEWVDFAIPKSRLLVAQYNTGTLSKLALERGYGGITGHYSLLGSSVLARHRAEGQKVGTGFPRSRNCLYREINRGVDWVFSDHAVRLQSVCHDSGRD